MAGQSQGADTTVATPSIENPGFFRRTFLGEYPSPRTAVILSLVLPGAGQVYNKKWWKLPIAYGVLGTLIYLEVKNVHQYRALRNNYKWAVDDDPTTNPTPPYNRLSASALREYRDQSRNRVERNALGIGLAYLLTAADAFVDAHLARFDVEESLSGRLRPSVRLGVGGMPVLGIEISTNLSK
ncbi:MAG: DUF5683 domain-containing protein [Saprospiraceae bacterium]|nr:DUF5683 domain-containing protein [Saprospiraceae bacterium]MDW8483030.1 DUF5683 domain-containing protein [Saprospiraceae bacterium]